MKSRINLGIFFVLLLVSVFLPRRVTAHEPHGCPEDFPDNPSFPGHIDQVEIVSGELTFEEVFEAGHILFEAVFNLCDGQGRPGTTGGGEKRVSNQQPAFIRTSAPDSSSCAGCHSQPRTGGGGDFVANVFVLAQNMDPVTESVSPKFSNERNTLGIFGAGPIEMLGREMTADLHAIRDRALQVAIEVDGPVTLSLDTKGVNFGVITAYPDGTLDTRMIEGIDKDLIIKPFHQAGVVRSIREFTANGMNHHHGMQAEERFDLNPVKGADFDEDGIAQELTIGDLTAISIFQAALGTPGRVMPVDPGERRIVERGEVLFSQIGCSTCHVPEIRLDNRYFTEPYSLNPPGTYNETNQLYAFDMTKEGEKPHLEKAPGGGAIIRPFTDLKRHNLCDDPNDAEPIRFFCNEILAQGRPDQDNKPGTEFFLTRKLWDVGNSAPYGHRGDLTTITEAILYHGGEARGQRDEFTRLGVEDQASVVKFLKSLQVLPEGSPRVITEKSHQLKASTIGGETPLIIGSFGVLVFGIFSRLRKVNK
jgi:hypothetical protein